MTDKVMLIFSAHADDTEFLAGGTVAKFADEGWEIHEVIATNNERGSFELDRETLIKDSEKEGNAAGKVLGKKNVTFLDYPDGNLADTPINELRKKFIRLIRQYRPRAVMTWDYWAPFEPHPDHRAVAQAAMEALYFAHMPLFYPEHREKGLEPHMVIERRYFAKDPKLCDEIIDISPYIDKKIDSLCVHDSQMKLTVDDLIINLEALGATDEMTAKLDRNNYRPLLEIMVKSHFAEVGGKAGYQYGEEFRHERAGGEIAKAAMEMLK